MRLNWQKKRDDDWESRQGIGDKYVLLRTWKLDSGSWFWTAYLVKENDGANRMQIGGAQDPLRDESTAVRQAHDWYSRYAVELAAAM